MKIFCVQVNLHIRMLHPTDKEKDAPFPLMMAYGRRFVHVVTGLADWFGRTKFACVHDNCGNLKAFSS